MERRRAGERIEVGTEQGRRLAKTDPAREISVHCRSVDLWGMGGCQTSKYNLQ